MAESQKRRIGERIKKAREAKLGSDGEPLSQRELARMLPGKVDGPSISRWETGKVKPGDDYLDALATALDVDVSFFLVEEPKAGTPDLMTALNGNGNGMQEVLSLLRSLDARLQRLEAEILPRPSDEQAADLAANEARRTREQSQVGGRGSRGGHPDSPVD